MRNMTVLYYSSNRESPLFEHKIVERLLKSCEGLPIVSVTQRPLNLGRNICVGNVGHSYLNQWRQMIIGAEAIETDYVILAEADFIYPEEYFRFKPDGHFCYKYNNIWIAFTNKGVYFKKKSSEGAQICERTYMIEALNNHIRGFPQWLDDRSFRIKDRTRWYYPDCIYYGKEEYPCVSFKTGYGVRGTTSTLPGNENKVRRLPYWGHINDLRKEYLS